MSDSRLRLLLQFITNVLIGGVISAAWLMGKISADVALIPLLGLAGLDFMHRKVEANAEVARTLADSSSPPPPGALKARGPLPSPGPTTLVLWMALEAAKQAIGILA